MDVDVLRIVGQLAVLEENMIKNTKQTELRTTKFMQELCHLQSLVEKLLVRTNNLESRVDDLEDALND